MSTIFVYTCNRCNKKVEDGRSGWITLDARYQDGNWDLCTECKEKFFCFLKKKPYKD
jgi:hypothetical protein